MLSNGAIPACNAQFQYLRIPKIFALEYWQCTQAPMPISTKPVRTSDELLYFWLGSPFCKSMTIQLRGPKKSACRKRFNGRGARHDS
jgi:hypothetical protein